MQRVSESKLGMLWDENVGGDAQSDARYLTPGCHVCMHIERSGKG